MSTQASQLDMLEHLVSCLGTAPTMETMPRRSLLDKGIAGPTAAHFVEEAHVPYNLAYVTFTTGTTAFQNIVGVTWEELPERIKVSDEVFQRTGVPKGAHALVTYAPLLNVYVPQALKDHDMSWSFMKRSSRDAFLLAVCRTRPQVVIGESSFLRVALEDAVNLGFASHMPRDCIALCSGTALDLNLLTAAERFGWKVHDLYGCQEFGWLVLDGVPLRDDIVLAPSPCGAQFRELVVGGLPMADSFLVDESGHLCNRDGKILTYRRERTHPEYEVHVKATPAPDIPTAERTARSVLRIKGRVVKVLPDCQCNAAATELELVPGYTADCTLPQPVMRVQGPQNTRLYDTLAQSVIRLKETGKTDPTWVKNNDISATYTA